MRVSGQMSVGAVTLAPWKVSFPLPSAIWPGNQNGVVSRSQAIRAGLSTDMIKFRLRSGRWRLMHRGVYATFTGVPGRGARLWAAVLSAGPGAVLSYQTAAELHGLADRPTNPIHVTVPHERHVLAAKGVACTGRAGRLRPCRASTYPPRTKVEETVLDLTQTAKTFDDVCGWVTRAIARDLTDETRLQRGHDRATGCAGARTCTNSSWRRRAATIRCWSSATTGTWSGRTGCRSRLGRCRSPRRAVGGGGVTACTRSMAWWSSLTGGWRTRPRDRWKDKARDNAAAADGKQSLRYGWAQVNGGLRDRRRGGRGAPPPRLGGRPRPCSPSCPVQRTWPGPAAITAQRITRAESGPVSHQPALRKAE